MQHLNDIELERFMDGNLSFFKRFLIKRHLASCETCRKRLKDNTTTRTSLLDLSKELERFRQAEQEISQSRIAQPSQPEK